MRYAKCAKFREIIVLQSLHVCLVISIYFSLTNEVFCSNSFLNQSTCMYIHTHSCTYTCILPVVFMYFRSGDFLLKAFELFADYDFCVITVPQLVPEFPLLQDFVV